MRKTEDISHVWVASEPPHAVSVPAFDTPAIADGLHLGMSDRVYHEDRSAISSTRLKVILRSPAHFKDVLDNAEEDKACYDFGKTVHAALLEPKRFLSDYVAAPTKAGRSKDALAEYEKKMKEISDLGLIAVDQDDFHAAQIIAMRIERENPLLWKALQLGVNESSIFWTDKETGIRLKVRPDTKFFPEEGKILCTDVKTIGNGEASPRDFGRQVLKLGYDFSAAMYSEGIEEHYRIRPSFLFLVIESSAPYGFRWMEAPPEMLEDGRKKFRRALNTYKACLESDTWPGYQQSTMLYVDWPKWAREE